MKKKNLTKILAIALIGGTMSLAVACDQSSTQKYDVVINGTTESVQKNELLQEPMPLEDYEQDGYLYEFVGWEYTDSDGNKKLWNFETDKVTGNVTLTPKYNKVEIPLTVIFKNGTQIISTTVVNKSLGKVEAPTNYDTTYDDVTANKRYTFEYWYVLDGGEEKVWNFNEDTVTQDNTVIYAKYSSLPLTVSVTINGSTVNVNYGETIQAPEISEQYESGGYLFTITGWEYTDSDGNTKLWNFETDRVTGSITLTPKYSKEEIPLNVTFMNGTQTISTVVVNKSDGKVSAPEIQLTYDDVDANKRYTFEYWYVLDGGVKKKWNFNTDKVKDNTVIYAEYSSLPLTIDVIINGKTITVNYGDKVEKPEINPVKDADAGYTYEFKYWICDGNLYDFSTPVTEPIEIVPYFKTTARLYNISIDLDNGSSVITRENAPYGTELSDYTPINIKKESTIDTVYTFSHFEDSNGDEVTTVNGSATYKAIYTESVRKYDLTVIIDGKSSVLTVEYGANILETLKQPEKDEDDDAIYTFLHWVDDMGTKVEADDTVSGEMTYSAVFDVEYKRYTISFDVAGKVTSQKINVGEKVIEYLPTNTDRAPDPVLGILYTFSHFEDSEGNEVTDETVVAGEETYTAIYDEVEYGGTMSISDVIVATKESGRYIPVIFSKKDFSVPLTYTFEGNDISISENGFITVNNVGKEVTVTATNEQCGFEDTFVVKTYDKIYDYVSTNFDTNLAKSNNFSSRYETHKADIEAKLDKKTPSIVFVGDSFFDAGRYNAPGSFWSDFYTKYFPGMNAYSFGVGGTRSEEITDWISAIAPYAPQTLVIHVGTNDIYDLNKDGQRTAQDIVDMLATAHNALPNTHIYYISVEYRTAAKAGNIYEDISNAAAKAYCDNTNNVTYLDSLPYFTTTGVSSGGVIDANKLRDSVHLKLENYSVYIDLLKNAGVNFDDYVVKVKDPILQACGNGTVALSGDTLTINNAGQGTRTRAYLYDTENEKYIQGDVAVWGTLNMKDIVVANNQFAEILLMENPDNSWATANNYNIIDVVIRKHGNADVVKPIVWGYGVGGENAAYSWDNNDYTVEFSLVVKDKKAYITLDGVTKTIQLYSDSLYIGFGSENLNYTVTGFTVSTDKAVIESKLPANRVINDVEEYTTDVSKAVRDNAKQIMIGAENLSTEFIISGKLDLIEAPAGKNAHIEFKFNGNDNYRFLLWDNNDSVNYNYKVGFNMGSGYDTNAPTKDIFIFDPTATMTVTWKIVVTGGYQMFYVNDQLRVVNKGGSAVSAFNLSAEYAKVKFYDIKAYMSSNDSEGFATQKALVDADINKYASSANGTYRV